MGKIGTFISSFKSYTNNNDTNENEFRNNTDDYNTVAKSKEFYVVSAIISIMAALLIWLVAVTTGTAVGEKPFAVSISMNNYGSFVSAAEQSGFNVVIAESDKTISFTLEGRKKSIENVSSDDIFVQVDFDDCIKMVNTLPNDKEQTISAPIVIDAPVYFAVSDISKTEITIRLIPINMISE